MKRCKKCGETKPLHDFYLNTKGREGTRPECKACTAAARKRWYEGNKEREIARVRTWQQENAAHLRAYRKVYRREKKGQERDAYLRRKFGITLDDYAAMLEAQDGGCAICGRPEPEGGSLHVDHDHETGAVRGLLCFRCNGALGQLDEDPDRLAVAIAYLGAAAPGCHDEDIALAVARARCLTASLAP